MNIFTKPDLEQLCLDGVFWYNKQWVHAKHHIHALYLSNNAFRIVYDLVSMVCTFIKNVFSFLMHHLFYVETEPDGTWLSIVSARKDSDSNPHIMVYYTTFGQLLNIKSKYDMMKEWIECALNQTTKIMMGTEYMPLDMVYLDMNASVNYNIIMDEYPDDVSVNSELTIVENTYDVDDSFSYSVSNDVLSHLMLDHIASERKNYLDLHKIYNAKNYTRRQNVVDVVNRDGTKYEFLDTVYVDGEGMQRYSPLTQSMVVAHKNGYYEFRLVHWLNELAAEPVHFAPSLVEFLEVEYHHPDMDEPIQIQLPTNMMVVNNDIFSFAFIGWYLKQLPGYTKYVFDDRYTIHLVDDQINMVVLRSNQYIKLRLTSYEVMDGQLM